MRIDWGKEERAWRVLEDSCEVVTEIAKHIILLAPCELVLTENGNHGYLVVAGKIERKGDTIVIRELKHG